MPNTTFRSLLERAALDATFRANLLADPALRAGLTRDQIRALLDELALLDGQLTDEILDGVAGGISRGGALGRADSDDPKGCPA